RTATTDVGQPDISAGFQLTRSQPASAATDALSNDVARRLELAEIYAPRRQLFRRRLLQRLLHSLNLLQDSLVARNLRLTREFRLHCLLEGRIRRLLLQQRR